MKRIRNAFVKSKNPVQNNNVQIPIIIIDSPLNSTSSINDDDGDEPSLNCSDVNDDLLELESNQVNNARRLSLRRNSVSLPNIDDLEAFKIEGIYENALQKASENGIRSDFYNSENEFSDVDDYNATTGSNNLEDIEKTVPLRNARRKSITITPRMLKPPPLSSSSPRSGEEESINNSPANSITSINSLASLLREKMQSVPATIKKKKPKDYKMRAFVSFLFLTIVFLVGVAYILYHQKVLHRAYFERIKFSKTKRLMKIYNSDGLDLINARLGTTLGSDNVYQCLPQDERNDNSICLEWMHRARLYLNFYDLNDDVRCYNLQWMSLSKDIEPTDCIDLTRSGHWYGGGQSAETAWPLEKSLHDFAPFVTGRIDRHRWGNVLKRYFFNSRGAGIIVDKRTPLYVSINKNSDGQGRELCLKARFDDFAYVNHLTPHPKLNYSICTSTNMTRLYSTLTEKSLWDGLKNEENNIINSLLSEPLWQITSMSKEEFNEGTVSNYTENVIQLGFLKQGHVLINEFWQKHVGDFTVDKERFPTLEETMNIMHRRGFRIVFSIQPFISTESANFAETVRKRLLVSGRFSDRRIPTLTRYKSLESAGVLDITNNRTIPWLLDKLKDVLSKYQFDAYYLDLGVAYNMPHYYQCERTLRNPDQYKSIFINQLQNSVNLFGVSSAVERPRPPIFVSLPMFESSWSGLRRVIPTILTYGVIGYPFLIPGAVGGDYELNAARNYTSDTYMILPDKELYIRWLQLATFLPVIRFTHLPSTYGDDNLLEMAKVLTLLRHQTVTPLLKKYAGEALDLGLPLIRPLWMLEPNDQICYTIPDEFSIGEDLIVAPILYSGARQREVYLPAGVWKDAIDGSLRKGNRWLHEYDVGEHQIAYFERMPDNTRF